MKAMLRLTLAVAILAGLPAIATSTTTVTIPWQPGGGESDQLRCVQFCSVALCPEDKPNCGPLPGGGCGCSGGFSIE